MPKLDVYHYMGPKDHPMPEDPPMPPTFKEVFRFVFSHLKNKGLKLVTIISIHASGYFCCIGV